MAIALPEQDGGGGGGGRRAPFLYCLLLPGLFFSTFKFFFLIHPFYRMLLQYKRSWNSLSTAC